jgi:Flp pilus assembly pilin Flp
MMRFFALAQVWAGDGTRALRRQEGQTMAEYGVVLAVITLTCIAAFTLLSDRVRTALTNVAGVLPG